MKIFFTSYTTGKLGDKLGAIYMAMDEVLNERLSHKDYGPGLEQWFLMFIMVPSNFHGANDPERVLFKKKQKVFDLRLHLSNEAFRQADEAGRKALVVECIMRSLDLIEAKKIPDFDIQALKDDVAAIAHQEGWIGALP